MTGGQRRHPAARVHASVSEDRETDGFIIAHCGDDFRRDGANKTVSITQGWKKPLRRDPTSI